MATNNSVNRLCYVDYPIFTLGYQKFLHRLGVQEVTSQKFSDNVKRLAGCRTVFINLANVVTVPHPAIVSTLFEEFRDVTS